VSIWPPEPGKRPGILQVLIAQDVIRVRIDIIIKNSNGYTDVLNYAGLNEVIVDTRGVYPPYIEAGGYTPIYGITFPNDSLNWS